MEAALESLAQQYQEFSWGLALGVCIAYFVVDALYAYYTLAITKHQAFAAASTGAFMHFLLALGVLSYVQNYLYIAPIAFGSFLGTYLLLRFERTRAAAVKA